MEKFTKISKSPFATPTNQQYSCKICLKEIDGSCKNDLNLVQSARAQFNPWDEIQELTFQLPSRSHHVCRFCRNLLMRRNNARKTIADIDDIIFRLAHGIKDAAKDTSKENEKKTSDNTSTVGTSGETLEVDLQVIASQPLVIDKTNNKNKKFVEIPKPLIIFNSNRQKVKIIEDEKVTDKNFHDYCETPKSSPASPTQVALLTGGQSKNPLFPSAILIQTPSIAPKQAAVRINPQTPVHVKVNKEAAKELVLEKSLILINKPPSLAPKVPPCFQNPIPKKPLSETLVPPKKQSKRNTSTATQTQSSFPSCWYFRVPKETSALISVRWPSSERHKIVPGDLINLAINLLRGSHQDIAKAVWNHDEIQKYLVKNIQKAITKEADLMCSEKIRSVLKKNSPEEIMGFTFDKMDEEMRQYCPLFHAMLKAVAHRQKKEDTNSKNTTRKVGDQGTHRDWKSTVCIAASACLCQRSVKMHALEMMLNMLEDGEKEALPKCVLKLKYIFVPEE